MQDCTVVTDTIATEMESGKPRSVEEVRRVLFRQGSIFFDKTLSRTSAPNLHTKNRVVIPQWFVDSHGDKFGEIVHLIARPTARIWTVRVYITPPSYINRAKHGRLPVSLDRGWNEFATFHGLVENDQVLFSLKAYSSFEVYIFHSNGEAKESSFPTWRLPSIEVQEVLPKKGYKKSAKRARQMQGKGVAAAQLVKHQTAQVRAKRDSKRTYNLNAKRKKDAMSSQEELHSALDIFKTDFVHDYLVKRRRFPEVMGQEASVDVHEELVMPFTKNFVESSQDFVETKITSVGFEDKNQGQTESQTSPLGFLSPSKFRNLNNLGGNVRVQTVDVLTGTSETNGEAGDRATHPSLVLQSDPSAAVQYYLSAAVQSDPPPIVQSVPSATVQSDPSAAVLSDPSAVEKSKPSALVQSDSLAAVQPWISESRRASEQPIVTVPTVNAGTRRKHRRPWTLGEITVLVECVARCGVGKWADIQKLGFAPSGCRTVVDLKDKWRNLVRASQAEVDPATQGERKKQIPIPDPILARVRELAFGLNQVPLDSVFVSSTNRKWRVVHRK